MKTTHRFFQITACLILCVGLLGPAGFAAAQSSTGGSIQVIVQASDLNTAAASLAGVNGTLTTRLPSINSFVASIPADKLAALAAAPGVTRVTEDTPVNTAGAGKDSRHGFRQIGRSR